MKALFALTLLLALAPPAPELRYFRYTRPVQAADATHAQACAPIDAALYAHSAPELADLRLYRNGVEEPYLLQRVSPALPEPQTLPVLNIGSRAGQTVFDVQMPEGRYDTVDLALAGKDFVASVNVSGSQEQSGRQTHIGSYTVFDLTSQKLGRGATLALPVSDWRFLHFAVSAPLHPQSIQGVRVTPVTQQPPRFIEVAHAGPGHQHGRITEITVPVPAHTPVDRIVFIPAAEPQLFERTVHILATPARPSSNRPSGERPIADGSLLRIHTAHQGQRIDQERLSIDLQYQDPESSILTFNIENGDDRPLAVQSVRLEMAERDLCFDAQPASTFALNYGDPALSAPHYDYATLAGAQPHALAAVLGSEAHNPAYQPRPDARPFTEKYPWLLWIALILVIGLLVWLTMRTAKKRIVTD